MLCLVKSERERDKKEELRGMKYKRKTERNPTRMEVRRMERL